MKLMVAQVFNLCTGGVLLSPGGTGFQPVNPLQDHRSAGGDACATKGLTSEFGLGS